MDARVMTLATGDSRGCWSAPVYYLYKNQGFYFFSSSDSRHIRDAIGREGGCAASVFHDSDEVKELRGLQMQGRIEPVAMNVEALAAAGAYVKKYKIRINAQNALAALTKQYRASFYRFVPEEIYYMDNRFGFGSRKRVEI
ncbi:MAG: hypothetical protein GY737_30450 [Desulfobacteraceae bacterium]|nr:hypothetical protein [Desulfobacteraceae bacterium]